MKKTKTISGFSKLSKTGKLKWLAENFFSDPTAVIDELKEYWHQNHQQQEVLDGFSENTISNFPMPYGVAPNFLIDNKAYAVPMVIEESSVVAAAAAAAKFWMSRGGFTTKIIGTEKVGQLHFKYFGDKEKLKLLFPEIRKALYKETEDLTANMQKRGGGISQIDLIDYTDKEKGYFQIFAKFQTCDSMGANFINSILERFGSILENFLISYPNLIDQDRDVQIIMAILSNYTPSCIVRSSVNCTIEDLGEFPGGMSGATFAEKFEMAVRIAHIDPYRATTHNKGIFNGVDAVVLATGNDFRAVEAGVHAYASKTGQYSSLTHCEIDDNTFRFWIEIPLALGTVGGLTSLHPLVKFALEMLEKPSAKDLMQIVAVAGLAQNFAAVKSLTTTGIQEGHMKMHLLNILNQFEATTEEKEKIVEHFKTNVVTHSAVVEAIENLRG